MCDGPCRAARAGHDRDQGPDPTDRNRQRVRVPCRAHRTEAGRAGLPRRFDGAGALLRQHRAGPPGEDGVRGHPGRPGGEAAAAVRWRPGPRGPGSHRRRARQRPARAAAARPGRHRDHGESIRHDLHGESRQAARHRPALHLGGAPAPDHRSHRLPRRAPGRRVQPDGGRPPARRQPRQRRAAADRPRRREPDDPQVRQGPVHRGRSHQHGYAQPPGHRRVASLRAWSPQHPHQRGHGFGQDDDPQRAVGIHSRRRAHRHRRGCRRTAAPAAPCAAPGIPPPERGGPGPGHRA